MRTYQEHRICHKCGKEYTDRPAISRDDNHTLICPDCGILEALESLGIGTDEKQAILNTIHQYTNEQESKK